MNTQKNDANVICKYDKWTPKPTKKAHNSENQDTFIKTFCYWIMTQNLMSLFPISDEISEIKQVILPYRKKDYIFTPLKEVCKLITSWKCELSSKEYEKGREHRGVTLQWGILISTYSDW